MHGVQLGCQHFVVYFETVCQDFWEILHTIGWKVPSQIQAPENSYDVGLAVGLKTGLFSG